MDTMRLRQQSHEIYRGSHGLGNQCWLQHHNGYDCAIPSPGANLSSLDCWLCYVSMGKLDTQKLWYDG